MVLATCWRSLHASIRAPAILPRMPLLRYPLAVPRLSVSHALPQPKQFSTSSRTYASGRKGGTNKPINQRSLQKKKTMGRKKKTKEAPRRSRVAIGERKALRKKVVLQNTQAPAIELPEMVPGLAAHEPAVGSVFTIPLPVIDQLRTLEAFQKPQNWHFFHRPATVMRDHTLKLGKTIDWVENGALAGASEANKVESSERHARYVIEGPKGSGKSVLMLQTMAYAVQRGWVVINIPNAQDLVLGHTEYEQDSNSKLWVQREYTKALLSRVHKANGAVLKNIKLSKPYTFGRHQIPDSTTLGQLVEMGSKDAVISHEVFNVLLQELEAPNRPPVLFALDGLNHISLHSAYRDTNYNIIHAHDLALPNTFIKYLTNARRFPRGITLAATTSACARTEALEYALRHEELPPYSKLDTRVAPSIEGAEVMSIGPVQKDEARALLEYYRRSGVLREALDEEVLTQRMALSAGLAKELLASCVRLTK